MLYLTGHDLAVDAADVDAGVDAGLVVGVDDVAPKGLIGTGSAVVWSLITKKKRERTEELRKLAKPVSFGLNWSSEAQVQIQYTIPVLKASLCQLVQGLIKKSYTSLHPIACFI